VVFHDEAEEEIRDNLVEIGNHLIGFVSDPIFAETQEVNFYIQDGVKAQTLDRDRGPLKTGNTIVPPVLIQNVRPLAARYQER
jgi:hypothetical protein